MVQRKSFEHGPFAVSDLDRPASVAQRATLQVALEVARHVQRASVHPGGRLAHGDRPGPMVVSVAVKAGPAIVQRD